MPESCRKGCGYLPRPALTKAHLHVHARDRMEPWEHVSQATTPFGPSVNTCLGHSTPSKCCVYFLSSNQSEAKPERGGRRARLARAWETTKDSPQRHGQSTLAAPETQVRRHFSAPRRPSTGVPIPPNTPSSSLSLENLGLNGGQKGWQGHQILENRECNSFVPAGGGGAGGSTHLLRASSNPYPEVESFHQYPRCKLPVLAVNS